MVGEAPFNIGVRDPTVRVSFSYRPRIGTAPRTPHPPDPADDAPVQVEFGDLADVTVEEVDWANSRSVRLVWRRAVLRLCRLTGSELGESTLTDISFLDCRLDLAGLRFAKLERVVFRDCRMAECDFYGASLEDVSLERCDLRAARFTAVKTNRVQVSACDLSGAAGVEALRGARMSLNDVLANAPTLAAALGIEIVD